VAEGVFFVVPKSSVCGGNLRVTRFNQNVRAHQVFLSSSMIAYGLFPLWASPPILVSIRRHGFEFTPQNLVFHFPFLLLFFSSFLLSFLSSLLLSFFLLSSFFSSFFAFFFSLSSFFSVLLLLFLFSSFGSLSFSVSASPGGQPRGP